MVDLSIIIVNWNTGDLLKNCLLSILKETKKISYEIIVLDNASRDNSIKLARAAFPEAIYVLNNQNLGFAKCVNEGMGMAKGKYLLLLNPDTEIVKNALDKMTDFMEKNSQVSILGPRILNFDGTFQPSVRDFPTFVSAGLILLKLHHLFPKITSLKKYFVLDFDFEKSQQANQLMGACLLIRRELLEEIGFFDENFYIWFEEVDFCKRAKEAKKIIYYYKDAEIKHRGAASFKQVFSLKKQLLFNKSLFYYFKKHHSFLAYLGLLLLSPFNLFLTILLLPFQKNV